MAAEKSTPKTEAVTFENCKSLVILKIKVIPKPAFVYRSIADLKALIDFVKSEPKAKIIEGKLTLAYGKVNLFDNCVVLLSEIGKVSQILTLEEAEKTFEIAAQK